MLRQRQTDRTQQQQQNVREIDELRRCWKETKDIGVMLLENFKTFSQGGNEQQTETLHIALDDCISKLYKANKATVLVALKQSLEQLLYAQKEAEEYRKAQRLNSLQRLITTITSSVSVLSGDSKGFGNQLNQCLNNLELFGSQEEIASFREQLGDEVQKLRRVVAQKQAREEKITQALHSRVQKLKQQLVQVNEELVLDVLVPVYNRRAFDQRLRSDIRQYSEFGGHFALLLFDIDHFKRVNDEHGHQVGDRILKALGHTAKKIFRGDDFVARYGGEEFAVILYNVQHTYATRAAERFRLAVAQKAFQYDNEQGSHYLDITISIGVSMFASEETVETLIDRADRALYLAKHCGRNQVKTEQELAD